MTFQTILLVLSGAIMFYFLVATRNLAVQRLFVVLFFGTGIVFILKPDITNQMAASVGIGRGADLVFYLSILVLFFLSFNFYLRFRRTSEILTVVIRELALRAPIREGAPGRRDEREAEER
jgi:hypothetical protein